MYVYLYDCTERGTTWDTRNKYIQYNTRQFKRGGQGGGVSPCQDVVELLKISAISVIYVRSRIRKYSRLISGNF